MRRVVHARGDGQESHGGQPFPLILPRGLATRQAEAGARQVLEAVRGDEGHVVDLDAVGRLQGGQGGLADGGGVRVGARGLRGGVPTGLERAGQGQGLLALLGAEVGVARAHGQAVALAADVDRHDLQRDGEVAHHGLDDRQLLGVLAAEQRPARGGQVHEGEHHLAHAGEVGGAGAALQDGGDRAGVDAHLGHP